jgi:hypothetical protein
MNLTKASYCSESFCCKILSYSFLTCSTLSSHILSAIIIICFRVNIGFSAFPLPVEEEDEDEEEVEQAAASISIMGSGELGEEGEAGDELGDGGLPGETGPAICRLFFRRLISSLKLLAICSGVSGVSLNTAGAGCTFSGVQWGLVVIGTHLLLLLGLEGECRGSKSRLLLRVTHAIATLQ